MTGWQLFGHSLLQNELWEKRVRSLSVICRFNKNFIRIGYWYFTTWISGVVGKLRLSQREGGARSYSRLNLTVLGPPHSPHPSLFPSSLSLSLFLLPWLTYLFNFILMIAQAEQTNRHRARVSPPQPHSQQLLLRTVRDTLSTGRRRGTCRGKRRLTGKAC